MMTNTQTLANDVGIQPACKALGVARAGYLPSLQTLAFS
jgi:hypothetical protein